MKITDIVIDWISDTALFEMAYQRKRAIEKVSNLQDEIAQHLVQVIALDHTAKKHWLNELETWLSKIDRIKLRGNKKLSSDVYYRLLFEEPLGEKSDLDKRLEYIYKKGFSKQDLILSGQEIYEKIESVLYNISHDLSRDAYTRIEDYV